MIFWIALVVFAAPTYLFVQKHRERERFRQRRIEQIRHRLTEKKLKEIDDKKRKISEKTRTTNSG